MAKIREYENVAVLRADINAFASRDNALENDRWKIISGVILHAADHGDCDPMTELFTKGSTATKLIFKRAIRQINTVFGDGHVFGGLIFPVFTFGQEKFSLTKEMKQGGTTLLDDLDTIKIVRKDILGKIAASGPADIRAILTKEASAAAASATIKPSDDKIVSAIKSLASVHAVPQALLDALNQHIGDPSKKQNVGALYEKGNDPMAAARKEFEAAKAKLEAYEKANQKAEPVADNDEANAKPAKKRA